MFCCVAAMGRSFEKGRGQGQKARVKRLPTPAFAQQTVSEALLKYLHEQGATKAFDFGEYRGVLISNAVKEVDCLHWSPC